MLPVLAPFFVRPLLQVAARHSWCSPPNMGSAMAGAPSGARSPRAPRSPELPQRPRRVSRSHVGPRSRADRTGVMPAASVSSASRRRAVHRRARSHRHPPRA